MLFPEASVAVQVMVVFPNGYTPLIGASLVTVIEFIVQLSEVNGEPKLTPTALQFVEFEATVILDGAVI